MNDIEKIIAGRNPSYLTPREECLENLIYHMDACQACGDMSALHCPVGFKLWIEAEMPIPELYASVQYEENKNA